MSLPSDEKDVKTKTIAKKRIHQFKTLRNIIVPIVQILLLD